MNYVFNETPRHMERTLERLLQVQAAMEELAVALEQAEGVRDAWEPVGDLFIDSLQDHIDATKVDSGSTLRYIEALSFSLSLSCTYTCIRRHVIMTPRYTLL